MIFLTQNRDRIEINLTATIGTRSAVTRFERTGWLGTRLAVEHVGMRSTMTEVARREPIPCANGGVDARRLG